MKRFIDLQTHTHYSDGALSPRALVRCAKRNGFTTIAITDHNTIDGIAEGMIEGKIHGVTVLPGVELYSTYHGKELHVLGYQIRPSNQRLMRLLSRIQQQHTVWLKQTIQKLERYGFVVDHQRLATSPSRLLGFAELIEVLRTQPTNRRLMRRDMGAAAPDVFDVINTYFVGRGIAAIPQPEKQLPTSRAIAVIRAAGGIPVLAHPGQTLAFRDDAIITALKRLGLRGIEAITPHHTWHQVVHYQELARQLRLFVTAGSDFHAVHGDRSIVARHQWSYFRPNQYTLPWNTKRNA